MNTEQYNWNNMTGFASGGRVEKAVAKNGDTAIASIKVGEEVVTPEVVKLAEKQLPLFHDIANSKLFTNLVDLPKLPDVAPVERKPVVINYENSVNVQGDLVRDTLPTLDKMLDGMAALHGSWITRRTNVLMVFCQLLVYNGDIISMIGGILIWLKRHMVNSYIL